MLTLQQSEQHQRDCYILVGGIFTTAELDEKSDINRSRRMRKTVLVQFRDPGDSPQADVHRSHAQGLMLRGIDPLEGRSAAPGTLDEGGSWQ